MYILGINESHTSTAAILKNGQIVACASEERFTRVKGIGGIPQNAISFCLKEAGISIAEVSLAVCGFNDPLAVNWYKTKRNLQEKMFWRLLGILERSIFSLNVVWPQSLSLYEAVKKLINKLIRPLLRRLHIKEVSKILNISEDKIISVDHHYAHAFAAYYIFGKVHQKRLVITNDGAGDEVCGRVLSVEGRKWREIASTPNSTSLAYLYFYITQFLGLTPCQDEHKVMGLAPYATKLSFNKAYEILKKLIWCQSLSFKSMLPTLGFDQYIRKYLGGIRFDEIASGIQKLTEELSLEQIKNVIKVTGIKEIVLGGGLAMNIKANMRISQILGSRNLLVCPSPADESTAIGACFWGYLRYCLENNLDFNPIKVNNLYLGPKFNFKRERERERD